MRGRAFILTLFAGVVATGLHGAEPSELAPREPVFVALTPADVLSRPEGRIDVLQDDADWSALARLDFDLTTPMAPIPVESPHFRFLSPADPSAPVLSLVDVLRTNGGLGQRAGGEAFWVPGVRWTRDNVELGVGLPIGVSEHADDWAVVGVISFRF